MARTEAPKTADKQTTIAAAMSLGAAQAEVSLVTKEGEVTITPIRRYDGVDGFKKPGDEPYAVPRGRAAELIANGLAVEGKVVAEVNNKMAAAPNSKST